jgi:hypothetical protein
VRAWVASGGLLLWGIAKRWWAWIVGVVIGALDVIAFALGVDVTVPTWAVWTLIGFGLAIAAIGTFHETRMEGVRATAALRHYSNRRGLAQQLAEQQTRGNRLRNQCDALGDAEYERLSKDMNEWCMDTRNVLLTVASEYIPEFERDGGASYAYEGPRRLSNLKVRLDGRLLRLGRIIEHLSA